MALSAAPFFSMFEITLGNWPPIGRVLAEEVSEFFMLFSVVHKLTIGFALVGVINGIFMQETFKVVTQDDSIMRRQKERATSSHHRKMSSLFKAANVDKDECISREEFESIIQRKDVKMWLGSMDFDVTDVHTTFEMLALDGKGITLDMLVEGVAHLKGPARSLDVVQVLRLARNLEEQVQGIANALHVSLPSQSNSRMPVVSSSVSKDKSI